MQDELKPCPWCSCKTPYATSPSLGQSYWRVVCDDCGAEGPPSGKDMHAPDCDAACIAAWNTRADDAELTRLRAENEALRGAVMATGPAIWRNAITNTAALIDRVRRSHAPKPGNKAYSAFDAALDDVIGKWVSFSRGVAPTTYAEAESEWKRFSATIAGGRDAG